MDLKKWKTITKKFLGKFFIKISIIECDVSDSNEETICRKRSSTVSISKYIQKWLIALETAGLVISRKLYGSNLRKRKPFVFTARSLQPLFVIQPSFFEAYLDHWRNLEKFLDPLLWESLFRESKKKNVSFSFRVSRLTFNSFKIGNELY